ncbi:MAG: carboxylesterase/lipase family protein [Mycobacteriales bacterium]
MARHTLRRTLTTAAVVLATLLGETVVSASGAPPGGPVVVTSQGALRGARVGGVEEFLGVPYAAPPVGALRWRAPRAAAGWSGVRAATAFGPHCAQPGTAFGQASVSEDCLYLNVYAPARHGAGRLPVMVWIHGGALFIGESDDFDPTALVRRGVVVVTVNYRLGALGFLAHPALAARPGGPSGNYGLMDQQAALRWVRRDVGAFGGDAREVTVFGESAGGLSTLAQLASPGAHGLFARALVESGSYGPTLPTLAAAETDGRAFATAAGCADQTAACLRQLPVSTILAHENTSLGYEPDIDGQVLAQQPSTAFATGRFNRVPVVDGTNHDEWRLFAAQIELGGTTITAANYEGFIAGVLHVSSDVVAAIEARYPLSAYPSPPIAFSALATDALYACTALTLDNALARWVPTFAYEFNDENAPPPAQLPPVSFPYGAAHSTELQYLFNLPGRLSAPQLRLADTMQRYWTTFAARGAPSWPPFNGTALVQSLVPAHPAPETTFATTHQCAFWTTVA